MLLKFLLVVEAFSFISCWAPEFIPNIYEAPKSSSGTREILILESDNTFKYLYHSHQGWKDVLCGSWFLINDSIHFKSFDTVAQKTIYLPDKSGILTIEVFDQYGCKFIWPVKAVIYPKVEDSITIIHGFYEGIINDTSDFLKMGDGFYSTMITAPIKKDSMHMQIFGLSYDSSKILDKTVMVKDGVKLKGVYFSSIGDRRNYVEKVFHPKKIVRYDGNTFHLMID